ncbi:MAG: T9SS type A sorting domain-containing protein [Janthinobacterium lividum]
MKKLLYLWLCLVGPAWSAQAQNAALACGNGRYSTNVFPDPPTKTADVIFGYNTSRNYASGVRTPITLRMDVYEPTGDVAVQRPLIILAFGGAFIQGSRQDADIVAICQEFARKGYVTAAIDYRILENDYANLATVGFNQSFLVDEVIRAVGDMKAAVRFFKHDAAPASANTYRIDPTKIFLGGFSAGAITALEAAYTDDVADNSITQPAYIANGGLEGNTDLPAPNNLLPLYNSAGIAGVFNIAGGVSILSIVDAGDPPLYSAQGTADTVVPYDNGNIQFTSFNIYGSHQLQIQATAVGLLNQLHPVVGGSHSSPATDPDRTQIIAEAAAFLQAIVCPAAPLPVTLTSFTGRVASTDCAATLAWQTASERNSYAYEVQASGDGKTFALLGTVPSQNRAAGAGYTYRAGAVAGTRYFRLRLVDTDGTATYSPVVTLVGTCEVAPLLLAPNPVRDYALVSGLPTGRCQLLLFNATGQRVVHTTAEGSARLILSGLPAGVYLLKVIAEDGLAASTTRLIKE